MAAVGRIGDGLGVAHHARLEDELSGDALLRAKAVALVGRAIFKLEADELLVVTGVDNGRRGGRVQLGGHCVEGPGARRGGGARDEETSVQEEAESSSSGIAVDDIN